MALDLATLVWALSSNPSKFLQELTKKNPSLSEATISISSHSNPCNLFTRYLCHDFYQQISEIFVCPPKLQEGCFLLPPKLQERRSYYYQNCKKDVSYYHQNWKKGVSYSFHKFSISLSIYSFSLLILFAMFFFNSFFQNDFFVLYSL